MELINTSLKEIIENCWDLNASKRYAIETILKKFGIRNFFWSVDGSDIDLVFEDQKSKTKKLRDRLHSYVYKGTISYPYTVEYEEDDDWDEEEDRASAVRCRTAFGFDSRRVDDDDCWDSWDSDGDWVRMEKEMEKEEEQERE